MGLSELRLRRVLLGDKSFVGFTARLSHTGDATNATLVLRANGQRIGSVPYGLDLDDDGATLVPNEAEQAVIAEIQAWRAAGWTLERIADELTQQAVPTKTGKSGTWTHQAVARILRRP